MRIYVDNKVYGFFYIEMCGENWCKYGTCIKIGIQIEMGEAH